MAIEGPENEVGKNGEKESILPSVEEERLGGA